MKYSVTVLVATVIVLTSVNAAAQTSVIKDGVEAKITNYYGSRGSFSVQVQNITKYPIRASVQIRSKVIEDGKGAICNRTTSMRQILVKPYETETVSISGGCVLSMGWGARRSDNTIRMSEVEALGKPWWKFW